MVSRLRIDRRREVLDQAVPGEREEGMDVERPLLEAAVRMQPGLELLEAALERRVTLRGSVDEARSKLPKLVEHLSAARLERLDERRVHGREQRTEAGQSFLEPLLDLGKPLGRRCMERSFHDAPEKV